MKTLPPSLLKWFDAQFKARSKNGENPLLRREEALTHFKTHGFPTRHSEAWKYTNFTSLQQSFEAATRADSTMEPPVPEKKALFDAHLVEHCDYLLFYNGEFMPLLSQWEHLNHSAVLEYATDDVIRLMQSFEGSKQHDLQNDGDKKSDGLTALNTAFFSKWPLFKGFKHHFKTPTAFTSLRFES